MKNFYLVGKNINNSLSPFIHNYIFNSLKINAIYKLYQVDTIKDCLDFIKQSSKNNIDGINITNPFKKEILPHIHEIYKADSKIKAINCLSFNKDKIIGHNTDWVGFLKMVEINNISFDNKDVHIIGDGGSFKAIFFVLKSFYRANIKLYNRQNIDTLMTKNLKKNSVVINCTPKHFLEDSNKFRDYFINRNFLWIDLLYTKLSTENYLLLNENHKQFYLNGIDMLIFQAIESINIWLRKDIHKNVDLYDIKQKLKGIEC